MMDSVINYAGKILVLIFILSCVVGTCYGIIVLGTIVFKWLTRYL